MNVITLSALDLSLASLLLVILALTSMLLSLGLEWKIVLLSCRMIAQLLAIGLVLRYLFAPPQPASPATSAAP